MSAAIKTFENWVHGRITEIPVDVHLFGFENEEISGSGYAPVSIDADKEDAVFVFTGKTPLIYGFYLGADGTRFYTEPFPQPWQALNPGDALTLNLNLKVKVKRG